MRIAALVLLAGFGLTLAPRPAAASDVLTLHSVTAFRKGNASSIIDPARRRLVVVGGMDLGNQELVEVLDLAGSIPTWRRPVVLGTPPPSVQYAPAVHDRARDRMIVLVAGSMWCLSLAEPMTWTHVVPTGTAPVLPGAAVILDPVRDRIVGHGGTDPTLPGTVNASWTLSLGGTPAWAMLATAGGAPPTRSQAASLYDPALDRMIVSCGLSGDTERNDTWQLSFAGGIPTWNPMTTTGTPQ